MIDYRASVGRVAAAIALLLSVGLLGGHSYAAEPDAAATQEPAATAQEPDAAATQEPAAIAQEPDAAATQELSQEPDAAATQEPSQEPDAAATQEPSQEPAAQEPGYPDCTLEEIASPPTTGCVVNRGTTDAALLWSSDEGSRYRLSLVDGGLLITYFDGSSILLDKDGNVIRTTDASPAADSSSTADSLASTGVSGRSIGVAISLVAAGGIVLAATVARRHL